MRGAAGLGSRATPDLSTGVRRDEKVVTTVGLNVGSGATGKDPAGSSTGSPRWSKVVKDGRSRQNPRRNVAEGSGACAISIGRKRTGPVLIVGTSAVSTILTVRTKLVSVFATKFSPDLEAETLSEYLKSKLIKVVTCQKIQNVRSRFGSFKVTAGCNDISEMYTPELWPEGALVRRYYEPRMASAVGSNNVPSVGEVNVPSGVNSTL